MDGGGTQSSEERGAERLMDEYLRAIGLHRKRIAKDGSCLFRAVAEQVLHCQSLHTKVRSDCVDFLRKNRSSYEAFIEGDFEEYLCKLQDPQQWVGEVEINALAVMYKRDFLIYQEPSKPAVNITDNNFKDKVQLCFLNGNHYDSVYPISRIKNAALCQSILYELLYEGVFKVDRSFLGVCQRHGRPSDFLSDDSLAACLSSDESDLDTGEELWVENGTTSTRHGSYRGRGRGGRQLPERVKRSLNPTLLRNVQYDVWHKTKKAQQKMDYCIAAGMQFTVGDRCQVRLDGSSRTYNATVKEVPPSNGPVTVYIEELGRKQVPLWSLRPPSDESSWSTVINRDKRLSNGHGEWEEKGRGRGRGKSGPPSSSVALATAPGSSGRVLKQHSWPPQASVEEQGGAKTSRKSVSSVDSAFGLTEEQRLAKEEEERNVALVEIQLRDEHSFPALGTQAEGGRKKGGEKRRPQRNKTKSPVEDVRPPSPSTEVVPKPSTPPPATTAATSAPPSTSPTTSNTCLPAAPSDSGPAWLTSLKAPTPSVNMAAAAASGSASSLPHTAAAPPAKANAQSYASAVAPSSPPPAAAPSAKPSAPSGAPPPASPSFITPVLPAASSPPPLLLPSSSSPPSSSSSKLPAASPPPPQLAASPPPPSSAPPTFIAPIAPSPTAAQGFPRSSPTPPTSSVVPPPAHEAPPAAAAQTTNCLPKTGGPQTASQTSLPQIVSQAERQPVQPGVPQAQNQASLPQVPMPPVEATPQSHLQPESDGVQILSSHPAYPHPHPHVQPPHPSQVPHPSLSLSASPSPQSSDTQSQTVAPPPPPPPPHPSQHPQPQPAPPPQSIPGTVPLQQMSQLYQDPLYPGFPQGEGGGVAPTPPISTSKAGDDLPRDVNILRFFFNLGVKAYSMPMFPPYIYLLPLQQAHTIQPKLYARSPSPHYPPSTPPTIPPESYPAPQYPPAQYDPPAPLTEPPPPSEPSFPQAGYPLPHRLPWQQAPRNPSYPVRYPSPTPPYSGPPPTSQGYHSGQGPGHPLYPPAVPPYPSSMGFQAPSTHEELQVNQGVMEQLQPTNGNLMPGLRHVRVPGPVESPAASVANATSKSRAALVPSNYALKNEAGESLTRTMLLMDPTHNRPVLALVPDPDIRDVPVSVATMKPSGSPGLPSLYGAPRHPVNPTKTYAPLGAQEPSPAVRQAVHLAAIAMAEPLSVGCSTEDDWEGTEGFKPTPQNLRGQRRSYRGGRGRGGHDAGRHRRRPGGEMGGGFNYQFSSSHRGRGQERGY